MARKEEEPGVSQEHSGYVSVLVARSRERAEHYCQLFIDHDIDAIVGDDDLDDPDDDQAKCKPAGVSFMNGVPVLVAEEMLDEAKEIIADREDLDEFQVVDEEYLDQDDDEEEFAFVEEVDEVTGQDGELLCDDEDEADQDEEEDDL